MKTVTLCSVTVLRVGDFANISRAHRVGERCLVQMDIFPRARSLGTKAEGQTSCRDGLACESDNGYTPRDSNPEPTD